MTLLDAIILGIVEGITEYLPVSSTGHLILTAALLGLNDPEVKRSVDAFNIVIQGGAILAVLGLYAGRVRQMILGALGRDPAGLALAISLFIAFLPAALLGPLLDDWIEARLFHAWPVLAALALGGVYMIVLDLRDSGRLGPPRYHGVRKEVTDLTLYQALIIGLFQCVAMWPGTSRSMMTITAGVLVGMRPRQAAEFSFLLGLPTLGGATVYKLAKDMSGDGPTMFETLGVWNVVAGLLVSTVAAAIAVRWLVSFLNKHGLAPFGWYRLALCAVLGGAIIAGWVSIQPDAEPTQELVEPDMAP